MADGDYGMFALVSSALHYWWGVTYGSTLETRLRYGPTDCFETFPIPWDAVSSLRTVGHALDSHRKTLLREADIGLTKTYNQVHNPDVRQADIVRLRELHVELDQAVRDAYGWSHLPLDHHHWETPQGMRFTVSRAAKDELLDRLLELNHVRYAAEVAAGLHDKKGKKAPAKRASKAGPAQETML